MKEALNENFFSYVNPVVKIFQSSKSFRSHSKNVRGGKLALESLSTYGKLLFTSENNYEIKLLTINYKFVYTI